MDPYIFEDPDAKMRAKMGLMDFPPLFVPPPDIPPIAPAAAANIMAGFSQYSDREFTVTVPVTTLDETPLNLTGVGYWCRIPILYSKLLYKMSQYFLDT